MHASGPFEVKTTPQESDTVAGLSLVRLRLDKQYHGDLAAVAQGQMLTAMTGVKGSAGYVAVERVTGTLHGKSGSFALQHSGVMTRGVPQLNISVVPDSGTADLAGLSGTMTIVIDGGRHSYEFDYTLP